MRHLRGPLFALACLSAAAVLGIVALVDHHWKQVREDRAEVAEWYCAHQGTRCRGPSSAGIETRWNQREIGYEVAIVILGASGAGLLVAGSLRRRDNRAVRQPPM